MSEPPPEEVVAEAEGVRLRLSDHHNGTYSAGYTLSIAGDYLLVIQEEVTGEQLRGSPHRVSVRAGPVHPPSCSLTPLPPPGGAPPCTITAGEACHVEVSLFDAHGNALPHAAARSLRVRFAANDDVPAVICYLDL